MESIGTAVGEIMSELRSREFDEKIEAETLYKVINIAFYASLQHEELQSLKFDFVYLDPANPDLNPPSRIRVSRWKTVRLGEFIPLTVEAVRKLGLATDRRTSSLAVYADDDGMPYIWGFVDQGTNTHLFDIHESNGGWPHPGIVHISVRDVGYLVITCQSRKIIEIKQDTLIYPALNALGEGHLSQKLDKVVDNLINRAAKYIKEFDYVDDQEPDSPYAFNNLLRDEFHTTLSRLILRIQGYGHGGAFIITPDIDSPKLNIKYKLNYDRLAESLVRYRVLSILGSQYDEVISEKFEGGRRTLDRDLYYTSSITDDETEDSQEELTGSIWFTSLLSRIDGLIVFDETLTIRGFGAEILVDVNEPVDEVLNANTIIPEYTLKTATPVNPSRFGTRHRSMMRYINAEPGAIGFVVSQDGAEKAMVNLEGRVVYWDGIKLTVH